MHDAEHRVDVTEGAGADGDGDMGGGCLLRAAGGRPVGKICPVECQLIQNKSQLMQGLPEGAAGPQQERAAGTRTMREWRREEKIRAPKTMGARRSWPSRPERASCRADPWVCCDRNSEPQASTQGFRGLDFCVSLHRNERIG